MSETQMQNPPKSETKMVAKGGRKIRVVALREFYIENLDRDQHGNVLVDNSKLVMPGQMVEVSENQARDLIKQIHGPYAFSGERHLKDGDIATHSGARARLATKADLEPKVSAPISNSEDPLAAAI